MYPHHRKGHPCSHVHVHGFLFFLLNICPVMADMCSCLDNNVLPDFVWMVQVLVVHPVSCSETLQRGCKWWFPCNCQSLCPTSAVFFSVIFMITDSGACPYVALSGKGVPLPLVLSHSHDNREMLKVVV